jgi:5-methylcytosine-specific restriction endonuclease McrA
MGTCLVCGDENIEYYKGNKSLCKKCKKIKSRNAYIPKSKKYNPVYYAKNKDRILATAKRYNETPKGRISAIKRIRRRLLYTMNITYQEWILILERYNHRCVCCGSKDRITIDHIVPLSVGGTDTIDNIQPLCKSCNSKKGTKTIDYRI